MADNSYDRDITTDFWLSQADNFPPVNWFYTNAIDIF